MSLLMLIIGTMRSPIYETNIGNTYNEHLEHSRASTCLTLSKKKV